MFKDCNDCTHQAKMGMINTYCLACMRAYGVHDEKTNKELADIYINFPKKDLFEPKNVDVPDTNTGKMQEEKDE